ncbi:uncharacterized protein isoform X1 [Rhodnius prolixus]|uniref:uncharacterized protein isoform X1 n=2 Tax=Rhodnius prolixus TaxID=13249 RepID=UPI003D18DDEE
MVKLELALKRNLSGLYPVPRFLSNLAERWMKTCEESLTKSNKISADSNLVLGNVSNQSIETCTTYSQVSANYPLNTNFSKLWFVKEKQRHKLKSPYTQPVATLKTYTYNNFRPKQKPQKSRSTNTSRNVFEKLKKLYRETIRIKTRNTVMKKKPYSLDGEDKEAMIDDFIKRKWKEARMPIHVDPVLTNHLLKQAEQKKSADLNISLSCSQHPYIPCPLQTSESFVSGNTSNYKHTSLAPLFTVDPIIINRGKKNNANSITRCISINFWNQFSNSSKQIVKEEESEVNMELATDEKKAGIEKKHTEQKAAAATSGKQKAEVDEAMETPIKVKETIPKSENTPKIENLPLIDIKNLSVQEKVRNIRDRSVNIRAAKPEFIDNILKTTAFKKKLCSKEDPKKRKQLVRHLDLNFSNKMTCPNKIKLKVNDKDKISSISEPRVMNSLKGDRVNIPKYTNNRLMKEIKKFYETGESRDGRFGFSKENGDLNRFKSFDNTQTKGNALRSIKYQHLLTGPKYKKK